MMLPEYGKSSCKPKHKCFGNTKQQWDETYPLPENIASDIRNGYACVLCSEGDHHSLWRSRLLTGNRPMNAIDGSWLSEQPYVVVHRLAVADEMKQKGIAYSVHAESRRA